MDSDPNLNETDPQHTEQIRRLLELEMLDDFVSRKIKDVQKEMRESDLKILEREETDIDIFIRYIHRGLTSEASYMRPMLDAVIQGYAADLPRRYK